MKKKAAKKKAAPERKAVKKKAAKKKAAPGRKAVKKKAAKKKHPKISPTQKTPEQEAAPETSGASSQTDGENQDPGTFYHDDPNYLEDSQHDDPYHQDYEPEDHDAYHAHHDDHYHHGHEEHQGQPEGKHAVTVPVPGDSGSDGSDDGGSTELDENGEEYGGPVKSFLEHMEDLRWTLIRCVASVFVAMVICLAGAPYLVETLAWPLTKAKQSLTENRETSLRNEQKSEILVRLTE